jgi:CRISPR-associated protein (TIGR02710 family)
MEFTVQLQHFRERTADPGFEGLILLGTERHNITAGLLLGTLSAPRVAFLTTRQTRDFPQYIADLLGVSADRWHCPPEDHSTTLQVYRTVRQLRDSWAEIVDPSKIAVDVTGGQKPMSVGLEKAAHVLGLTTIYVESDYWPPDSGQRGPQPGTQRLVIPPDPFTVFGDLEAAEAMRLCRAHDYLGAERIFRALAQRVPPPDGLRYATFADLAQAYAAWDSFDLLQAEQTLAGLVARHMPAPFDHTHIQAQAAALQRLVGIAQRAGSRGRQARETLADVEAVLPLLGSLHANALRREAQGRYDTAALLRYRCLELISQHRLATWGIATEQPDFREVLRRQPRFDELYRAVEARVGFEPRGLPRPHRNGRVSPIALFGGYMLLAALDDPLVAQYDIRRIRERAEARNKSILAHGYRLITHAEYQQFAGVVEELLDRLLDVIRASRTEWEDLYRFVDFS